MSHRGVKLSLNKGVGKEHWQDWNLNLLGFTGLICFWREDIIDEETVDQHVRREP